MPTTPAFSPAQNNDARRLGRRGAICPPIFLCALLLLICLTQLARAAETIPPPPTHNITDDAHVLSPQTVSTLNSQLEQFERDTSNQIVVALYPHMQSDDDLAAYTTRIFHTWHIGQKGKDNGAALFIFTQDHKMQIITGYGLEGALPDATCKNIIDTQIAPRFKQNDFDGGVTAGVNAMVAATKGEYKGTGLTDFERQHQHNNSSPFSGCFAIFIFIAIFAFLIYAQRKGWVRSSPYNGVMLGGGGWSSGGGGWSSGGGDWGGGGGGGGGFSGGGGDTGGGGAGGSW